MSKSAIVSGMGVALSMVTTLVKMIMDEGGDDGIIHRLVTPEGEATLRKMAKIAIEDAKAVKVVEARVPKVGDQAYTLYHGHRYEGILAKVYPLCRLEIDAIVPVDGRSWEYHSDFPGLTVGYDEPIVWDASAGMWYAAADYD